MRIAIVETDYRTLRLFELLLKHHGHEVVGFGRLENFFGYDGEFDMFLINPGTPVEAIDTLLIISQFKPGVPRILMTIYDEVVSLNFQSPSKVPCLTMPFSSRVFMDLVREIERVKGSDETDPPVPSD